MVQNCNSRCGTTPWNGYCNVTCCKDGAVRTHREAVKNDQLKKLISNTQALRHMQKKRFPEDGEMQQAAVRFRENLKKWQSDFKARTVTEAEFTEWLLHFNSKL